MAQRVAPDPVPALKDQLAREIVAIIQGFSQREIAVFLGIDQPRISDLKRGCLTRFTMDRLVKLVSRLDHDVALDIRHRTGKGSFVRRNDENVRKTDRPLQPSPTPPLA